MAQMIRNPEADVIESGTLRLTWLSAIAGGLAAATTAYNDTFKSVFPDELGLSGDQLGWIKAAILIAVILAFALIAVADLSSRAYVTGQERAAKARNGTVQVVPAPSNLTATITEGVDKPGYMVAAVRYEHSQPDRQEYLMVKDGEAPKWVSSDDVALRA